MPKSGLIHILNPNEKNRKDVHTFFQAHPQEKVIWVNRTSHPTHIETIAEWVRLEKHRHVMLWGGDGTFSRFVQALFERGILKETRLTLIPVGTGNDFARKLGLKNWQTWAVSLLSQHKNRTIKKFDLGIVSNEKQKRVFVNNAGFGRTPAGITKKRPNAWQDIQAFQEKRLQVEWSGRSSHQFETIRAFLMIAFNAPYFNRGMHFQKDMNPQDGLLDVVFVPPRGRINLFLKFLKARLGFPMWDSTMKRIDVKEMVIESDQDLYPQADGEKIFSRAVRRLSFSIARESLNLVY